jgi:peptidase E
VRNPVTLIGGQFGSRHFGMRPYLVDALRRTRVERPTALYLGVANGDDRSFGTALCLALVAAGAGRIVWPKLERRRERAKARVQLEHVDFVFVGGGDVAAGMATLESADLVGDLVAAAAGGTVFAGLSAGAIMLGQRWIRWAHAGAGDAEAETYPCLGLVPFSLDTHGEEDDWSETRAFARVRARETGKTARAYGVPSGGALVVTAGGKIAARGAAAPVFVAHPRGKAKIEAVLPAEP